jgi:hypothetical protein
LLLGVSALAVTFELAAGGAVDVSVDVDTSTLVGAGGAHPNVNVINMAAADA